MAAIAASFPHHGSRAKTALLNLITLQGFGSGCLGRCLLRFRALFRATCAPFILLPTGKVYQMACLTPLPNCLLYYHKS